MAGEELIGMKGPMAIAAALLFMGAGTNGYDAFSAVMSSPWSTEKFTQSPEEEKQARRYVKHAIVISGIYAGVGTILAGYAGGIKLAIWPLAGMLIVSLYMRWLYMQAISKSPQGILRLGLVEEIPVSKRASHLRSDHPAFIS